MVYDVLRRPATPAWSAISGDSVPFLCHFSAIFSRAHASWCTKTEASSPSLPCLTSPGCPDSRTNWHALRILRKEADFLRREVSDSSKGGQFFSKGGQFSSKGGQFSSKGGQFFDGRVIGGAPGKLKSGHNFLGQKDFRRIGPLESARRRHSCANCASRQPWYPTMRSNRCRSSANFCDSPINSAKQSIPTARTAITPNGSKSLGPICNSAPVSSVRAAPPDPIEPCPVRCAIPTRGSARSKVRGAASDPRCVVE